jgi:BTB/POZ domain
MEFELRQDVPPPLTYVAAASTADASPPPHVIPAHRAIVCARCPWLRRCLRPATGMTEAASRRIVLHDTPPDLFTVFLQFLYCGRLGGGPLDSSCCLSVGQLADLLLLADRYEVADLVTAVEAVLIRRLDEGSAHALLGLADRLGGELVGGLRRAAFDYLAARPQLLQGENLAADDFQLPDYLRYFIFAYRLL